MAKRRKYDPFELKPDEKTLVKSKTYGNHLRAKRGSRSKAEVNDAMKEHSRRLIASTMPAKLICDALIPFRINFQGGQLWQKLLAHFALQAKQKKDYSVLGIENMDLNQAYPTSALLSPTVKVERTNVTTDLLVTVSYFFSKRFLERNKSITDFRITIIFLFPDFIADEMITMTNQLPQKPIGDTAAYSFIQTVPDGAGSWLVCFKAEGCLNGNLEMNSGNNNKAMCLSASGLF